MSEHEESNCGAPIAAPVRGSVIAFEMGLPGKSGGTIGLYPSTGSKPGQP